MRLQGGETVCSTRFQPEWLQEGQYDWRETSNGHII